MGLLADIGATYRGPRSVMRRHLAIGQREDRALMYLGLACILIFIAQWPRLRREALFDEAIPFDVRVGGAMLAWIFIVPLLLYAIAALAHIAARALGGQGTWYSARLALFWSLLAASPLWLLNGLVAGFAGSGPQMMLTGAAALGVFLVFWALCMIEAEKP